MTHKPIGADDVTGELPGVVETRIHGWIDLVNGKTPFDYGAVGDGVTDDSAAFNAADADLKDGTLGDLIIPPGTYKLDSKWSIDPTRYSIRGVGAVTLDFTDVASGYAMDVITDITSADSDAIMHTISNFKVKGPLGSGTTVDGIRVVNTTQTPGNAAFEAFQHIRVTGFRDQWFYGNNSWLVRQEHCASWDARRRSLNLDGQTGAGEMYQFSDCTFANAQNSGNAVAVYTNEDGGVDATFTACSFDYCDTLLDINSAYITLVGCHLEGNHATNPMISIGSTPGKDACVLTILGGKVSPTEASPGRPGIITIKSTSSNRVHISALGVTWYLYDKNTNILTNASNNPPRGSWIEGGWVNAENASGTRVPGIGNEASLLINGNFENPSLLVATPSPMYPSTQRGWFRDVAASFYSFDTVDKIEGLRSLKVTLDGTSPGTHSLRNLFYVKPGSHLYVTGWWKIDSIAAGSIQRRISWYYLDHATRDIVALQTANMTSAFDWAPFKDEIKVPASAMLCQIDFQWAAATDGIFHMDDIQAWTL